MHRLALYVLPDPCGLPSDQEAKHHPWTVLAWEFWHGLQHCSDLLGAVHPCHVRSNL